MSKNSFTKNLILHIRYPWTACCILILWLGFAAMCGILEFNIDEIIFLTICASITTFLIALIGFRL